MDDDDFEMVSDAVVFTECTARLSAGVLKIYSMFITRILSHIYFWNSSLCLNL